MNRFHLILLLIGMIAFGGCATGSGSHADGISEDIARGLPEDVLADIRKVLASGEDKVILRQAGMPEGDPGEIICKEAAQVGTRIKRISCMTRFEIQQRRDKAHRSQRQILRQNAAHRMGN